MITTTGADPSKELEDFAAASVGREHYKDMAMGGGQQEEAHAEPPPARARGPAGGAA